MKIEKIFAFNVFGFHAVFKYAVFIHVPCERCQRSKDIYIKFYVLRRLKFTTFYIFSKK